MNAIANFRCCAALAGLVLLVGTEPAVAQGSVSERSNVIALNSLSTASGIGAQLHLQTSNDNISYVHEKVLGPLAERDGAVLLLAAGALLILVRNRRLLA